jgi:Domain of unknown function (DUF397)
MAPTGPAVVFSVLGQHEISGPGCVETANVDGVVLVRDTTNRDGVILSFAAAAWRECTASLR